MGSVVATAANGTVGDGTQNGTGAVVLTSFTSPIFGANGSATAPTYSFTSATNMGMYTDGSSLNFSVGGSRKLYANSAGIGVSNTIDMNGWFSVVGSGANSGIGFGSGHVVVWGSSSTNAGVTGDTGISRSAAGVVAVGNATAGNASGTLSAANLLSAPVAFASLPAGSAGMRAFINNSVAAPAFLSAAAGGGATTVPVFHDGTSWKVG